MDHQITQQVLATSSAVATEAVSDGSHSTILKPTMTRSISVRDNTLNQQENASKLRDQEAAIPVSSPPTHVHPVSTKTRHRPPHNYLPHMDPKESIGGIRMPSLYRSTGNDADCSENDHEERVTVSPQYGFYVNLTPESPQKYYAAQRGASHTKHPSKSSLPATRLTTVPSATEVSCSSNSTAETSSSSSNSASSSSSDAAPDNARHVFSQSSDPPSRSQVLGPYRNGNVTRPAGVNPVFQGLLQQHKTNRAMAIRSSGGGASPRPTHSSIRSQEPNSTRAIPQQQPASKAQEHSGSPEGPNCSFPNAQSSQGDCVRSTSAAMSSCWKAQSYPAHPAPRTCYVNFPTAPL